MGDRTTFMRALLSPVRKTRSPVRPSAAGPMRDFHVCSPLRGASGRRSPEEVEENDAETEVLRLSTARPSPRRAEPEVEGGL